MQSFKQYISEFYTIGHTRFYDANANRAKENLKGNTELEWHIDKGYSEKPPEYVALYSVDIDEDAGNTLFVDSRILEDIPDYYRDHNILKKMLKILDVNVPYLKGKQIFTSDSIKLS